MKMNIEFEHIKHKFNNEQLNDNQVKIVSLFNQLEVASLLFQAWPFVQSISYFKAFQLRKMKLKEALFMKI